MIPQATARRVVRTLATRNIDWSAPVFKGDHDVAARVTQFRSWVASADSMAEKYKAAPAAIDFKTAKSAVRDSALIDGLEALYKASSPPPETFEWSATDKAAKAAQIEEAKAELAMTKEMIDDTVREIALMKANRTNRDTTVTQLAEQYPDIAEEVEDELTNREWFKDVIGK